MGRGDEVLWRIARHSGRFRADDLSGGGAKITGGRWNRKGRAVLYASRSIALAMLETLAPTTDAVAVRNAFLVRIVVPAAVWHQRATLDAAAPPAAWLAANATPLLQVPSVPVPEESNVLINPRHPACRRISAAVLRQYMYDPRL